MSCDADRARGSRPYRRHELLMGHVEYPVLGYDGYGNRRVPI